MTREELQNKHGDTICEYCNKNIISEYKAINSIKRSSVWEFYI